MKRLDAFKKIVEIIDDQFIICNFGYPSRELYHVKDRIQNFYFLENSELSTSFALGVALARPNLSVWCIDSEESILKNLGVLSTISNMNPLNLTVIIIDNGVYDLIEYQETHTRRNTKLDVIARGSGLELITVIENREDIVPVFKEMGKGCQFVLIKTEPGNADVPQISISPHILKDRFINALEKEN
jgi:sulfopyruvate decarboxylase subunit beta